MIAGLKSLKVSNEFKTNKNIITGSKLINIDILYNNFNEIINSSAG